MTMVGVFHDPDLIERIADRIVVMEGGRLSRAGRVGEIEIPRFETQQEFAPRV
jgi:ABC-type glutathione transport system ATPase component